LSLCDKNVLKSDFSLHKLFLDILIFVDEAEVKKAHLRWKNKLIEVTNHL